MAHDFFQCTKPERIPAGKPLARFAIHLPPIGIDGTATVFYILDVELGLTAIDNALQRADCVQFVPHGKQLEAVGIIALQRVAHIHIDNGVTLAHHQCEGKGKKKNGEKKSVHDKRKNKRLMPFSTEPINLILICIVTTKSFL